MNDAPALKRADAGIAVGRKGCEAAEFVLADANFASIVAALREGRTVYDNIKKVISWTLPTNAGEALTIIVALFAGMALPITAVRGTRCVWVSVIVVIVAQLVITYLPLLQGVFGTRPAPLGEGLLIVGLGAVCFALIETEKQMRLAFRRPAQAGV